MDKQDEQDKTILCILFIHVKLLCRCAPIQPKFSGLGLHGSQNHANVFIQRHAQRGGVVLNFVAVYPRRKCLLFPLLFDGAELHIRYVF